MPPQTLVPGQPVAPAPSITTPQGVAQPVANAAPVPTALPKAPTPVATPAPVATPSFDTQGMVNSIANYYKIPGDTANIVAQGQTQGNIAGQQFEKQKAENEIDIQNKQNQLDPSKYTITKNPKTGGIQITNSMGDQVDLGTYVNLTGANPADVLKNSTDPKDVQFVTAYNNLQNYTQLKIAAQNGDAQAAAQVADYDKANPGLGQMELGQLSQAFMSKYGSFFGAQSTDNVNALQQKGVTPTISSQNNPVSTSAFENPNYQTLFANNQYQTALSGSGGSVASELASLESQANSGS